jgi:hypothetical protein
MDLANLRNHVWLHFNLPKGGRVWDKGMLLDWVQSEKERIQVRDDHVAGGGKGKKRAAAGVGSPEGKIARSDG